MLQVACTKYNHIVQLQSNILEFSLKHFHNLKSKNIPDMHSLFIIF